MRFLTSILIAGISFNQTAFGQSKLLESVKNNPNEAKALCNKFRKNNSKGISSRSKTVINEISTQKNLSFTDAEILSVYVIGMYCPDIN